MIHSETECCGWVEQVVGRWTGVGYPSVCDPNRGSEWYSGPPTGVSLEVSLVPWAGSLRVSRVTEMQQAEPASSVPLLFRWDRSWAWFVRPGFVGRPARSLALVELVVGCSVACTLGVWVVSDGSEALRWTNGKIEREEHSACLAHSLPLARDFRSHVFTDASLTDAGRNVFP